VSLEEVVELLGRERASAIVRWSDQDTAEQAMEAAVRGGFKVLEFTLTTPGALELINRFSQQEGLVVGAGTVLEVSQAVDAVAAGARFLVSPVADEKVIGAATEMGVAMMPGTHTPTEMLFAHRAGAPFVKLFPAPAGGPAYLRSVMGPLPFLKIVPTNGVDAGNARQWLDAGAYALGFVTSLFDPQDMRHKRYDAIEARAREILLQVRGTPVAG
jgi:2-dehydro-3-deoxyphosphogluconate aldolase / (4S)-4-hydroxy-2-oxoglutarate aldolase